MKRGIPVFLMLMQISGAACADDASVQLMQQELAELRKGMVDLRGLVQSQGQLIQEQGATISALQAELKRQVELPAPSQPADRQPAASPRALTGKWNPDIGVIADVVARLDSPKSDEEGADRISARAVELSVGSAVDPYSRLDATFSFSDFEEAAVEEAYYTHFNLPLGMTGRVGRFKPGVGKAIPVHRDTLDTVDEPLVIQRYFGVEGLNKSGADLKLPLDLPTPWTHEFMAGVLEGGNGEGGTAFGAVRRHPTVYAHLKNYFDITDASGLELGGSFMIGSKDEDSSSEVQIFGVDGTWIHRIDENRRLKLQAEAFLMDRGETVIYVENEDLGALVPQTFDFTPWGTYALADLRFAPQWSTGFRYDFVELVDTAGPQPEDESYSVYLTFYQSEYARWRAQFSHAELSTGEDDNQVLLQGTFAIGEHKHKIQ